MEKSKYIIKKYLNRLKKNHCVRRVMRPFADHSRARSHERYLRTPDCQYLKTLKDIHSGERCFILGNGPSLSAEDCNRLTGEKTFASNRIYKIFDKTAWRPTYYVSVDENVLSEIGSELENYDLGHMFITTLYKGRFHGSIDQVTRIFSKRLDFDVDQKDWNDCTAYISQDISDHICGGGTVTFCSIQIAIYMGFKEIYLLGVDNSYNVWINKNGQIEQNKNVINYFDGKQYPFVRLPVPETLNFSYSSARRYCDTHGIKIYNATRGGKLEAFERVEFDSLFGGTKE